MRAALLALVACGSSASPPPRGFLTAPPLRTTPHDPTKATLTGRVLLDGKPVRVFAVAIGDAGFVPNPGHRVHSARGQFSIPNLRPEPVNVWIAGPGFTPRKLRARELRANEVHDLGDVHVAHGFTVQGHVRDATGRPVEDATVSIERIHVPELDETNRWLWGHYLTTTDEHGAYRFDDVSIDEHPYLVAVDNHRISEAHTLAKGSATIDLVLQETGAIDATSELGVPGIDAVGRRTRTSMPDRADGVASFDRLVPGDYDVFAYTEDGVAAPPEQRVTVTAGQRTRVDLRGPATPIHVTLLTAEPCKLVTLHTMPRTRRSAGEQRCASGSAAIEGVTPGHYRACSESGCKTIDVLPAPAEQAFDLR